MTGLWGGLSGPGASVAGVQSGTGLGDDGPRVAVSTEDPWGSGRRTRTGVGVEQGEETAAPVCRSFIFSLPDSCDPGRWGLRSVLLFQW